MIVKILNNTIMIDFWLLPFFVLLVILFTVVTKYGQDNTLEVLIKIDKKIDVIITKI